jgi:miniconductance mechanosensitive channel
VHRVGGRRNLRRLSLDAATVRPIDDERLAAARALPEIAGNLDERAAAIGGPQPALAGLTNAGLYRAYLMGCLAAHPKRAPDTIWRVGDEDALDGGLPLSLLVYVVETEEVPYRLVAAEIYEHALAAAPSFGLRVYQPPGLTRPSAE